MHANIIPRETNVNNLDMQNISSGLTVAVSCTRRKTLRTRSSRSSNLNLIVSRRESRVDVLGLFKWQMGGPHLKTHRPAHVIGCTASLSLYVIILQVAYLLRIQVVKIMLMHTLVPRTCQTGRHPCVQSFLSRLFFFKVFGGYTACEQKKTTKTNKKY